MIDVLMLFYLLFSFYFYTKNFFNLRRQKLQIQVNKLIFEVIINKPIIGLQNLKLKINPT